MLLYNGNVDLICNMDGTAEWSSQMKWPYQQQFNSAKNTTWSGPKGPAGYASRRGLFSHCSRHQLLPDLTRPHAPRDQRRGPHGSLRPASERAYDALEVHQRPAQLEGEWWNNKRQPLVTHTHIRLHRLLRVWLSLESPVRSTSSLHQICPL